MLKYFVNLDLCWVTESHEVVHMLSLSMTPGLEVIKLEYSLRLEIKRNDWLLVDTCPQAANHCALF